MKKKDEERKHFREVRIVVDKEGDTWLTIPLDEKSLDEKLIPLIKIKLHGTDVYLLVDTGSNGCVLHKMTYEAIVKGNVSPVIGTGTVVTTVEDDRTAKIVEETIEISEIPATLKFLLVEDRSAMLLQGISNVCNLPVVGILGMDFLHDHYSTLDFDMMTLSILLKVNKK
jgi:hypothetical protein